MSAHTRPQRSIRGRIAALIVGTGLLGSTLVFTTVQAAPYTPYQNGYTWIAADCAAEPNTTRSDVQCITDKCGALYGAGSGAYYDCVNGAADKLSGRPPRYPIPPAPTVTPIPAES